MELDRERGRLMSELAVASSGKACDVKLNVRSGKVVRLKRDRTCGDFRLGWSALTEWVSGPVA